MRTTGRLALGLLLALALFTYVSSESEQQQQQQTGASHSAISEVPVAASNDTSPSSSRVAPTSEVGSSEEADDDNEEDDDDGTDNDEDDDEQEEDGEEEETSAEVEEEEDEYEDELRAVANDKAGELSQRGDDLSSELLRLGDKEFQEGERSYESYEQQQQPVYEVVRPVPGRSRRRIRRRLDKRQAELVEGLRSYLLDEYNKERLGDEEGKGLYAESLLKLLSKLSENPQRWERVHQLLNDLKANLEYSRRGLDTQKRLVYPTRATSTTSRPDRTTRRPKWKKKKKKKKKPKQHKLKSSTTTTTTTTSAPIPTVMGLATTETPWATTRPPSWRLVADRLFNPPWDQGNLRLDDTDIAKVRYSMPSKPRTVAGKNEDDGLEALNSEREALMLEAAREYSQPRPLHYGKINTHLRTSSGEDMDDAYSDRSHQRRPVHYGQLIPEAGSSRLDYPRNSFGSSLARNLEDLLPQRNQPKTWKQNGYRLHKPKNSWKWQGYPDPQSRPWLPWERDYFENADEDEGNSWEQQRQRAEWNRQSLRENFPPWLEEKEIQRVLQTTWSQPDKSREDPDRGNSFEHRNNYDYKPEDDSKESPKLTMKTWDSLTSDPATWPFKLPGAKPWPKDENGKSYNPNADLVRKLGLYSKNGRLRAEKEKQQKLQKHEKSNTWLEPDEQQSAWFNSLKQGYQDPERNRWNNETPSVSNEGSPSKAQATSGSNNNWPGNNKWNKQFAYHKVTAQPTSKSSVDKPGGKNAFIAVSAVSGPKYGNEWSSNDIEEMGNDGEGKPVDPNDPSSQMRMNKWKKSLGTNGSIPGDVDGSPKTDVLENQLEGLKKKDEPVLLEVNVSIKNSTVHSIPPSSVALAVEKTTAENNSTKTEQH